MAILFKRGTEEKWTTANPVLEAGQPGYVIGKNRLKVGDGITPWNELPYIGELTEWVVNVETHYDFPSIGKPNVVYKAEKEKLVYQWNESALKYEVIGPSLDDINLINGGNANG